jgi:septum formation protein
MREVVPPALLVLASASPRRSELLRAAGIRFDVVPADVDERQLEGEDADGYVRRLATEKASRVAITHPGRPILGADTTVVVDGELLGKPRDTAEAVSMLGRLSGRSHQVLTGVCLIDAGGGSETALATTTVEFRPLTPAEIDGYVASGEPMDKAGAYAIQGEAGRFVTRIHGPYDNVVGLPVALIQAMCERRGITVS